jgi:glycosyltransferase involved in cell wall biosynthesis
MTPSPVPVLYLITELSIGGAQNALLRLLGQMDRQRFSPHVACLYNGDGLPAKKIRHLDIPVSDLGMRSMVRLDAFWRFLRLIREVRPMILHTWMFHANIPGRILGRLTHIPCIVSSERTMGQENVMRRTLNRLTAHLADRIICVSQPVAKYAKREIGLPEKKMVVIPNGIDLSLYSHPPHKEQARSAYHLPLDALIIGAIGRPRPVKGYRFLLEAFQTVAEACPQAHLLFIGDGPDLPALQQQVRIDRLEQRVSFLGDQEDIPGLLAAIDLLTLPSLHEGMPNVAIEAMAASLPVVATAVGGTPEVVIEGKTGLLIPAGDPDSLAKAILTLLRDPAMCNKLGQAGHERVAQYFSIENTAKQTWQLYDSLLANLNKSLPSKTSDTAR